MIDAQPRNTDTLDPPISNGTVTSLVSGILDDAQKLVRQQFEMLVSEVHGGRLPQIENAQPNSGDWVSCCSR